MTLTRGRSEHRVCATARRQFGPVVAFSRVHFRIRVQVSVRRCVPLVSHSCEVMTNFQTRRELSGGRYLSSDVSHTVSVDGRSGLHLRQHFGLLQEWNS